MSHDDPTRSKPLGPPHHMIPIAGDPDPYPLADGGGMGDSGKGLPDRPEHRKIVGQLVIVLAVGLAIGATLRMPSQVVANDISRWCTVWSLLERGTFVIDDCPWQSNTQDKVLKPDKLSPPAADANPLVRLEYAVAPRSWKEGEPTDHYYSSKPPLLPVLIAAALYPARAISGVPLDAVVEQPREPRYVDQPIEGEPGKTRRVLETPKEPAKWPAYVLYFKPVILILNILPMWVVLVLYARLLDRVAENDWAWFLSLITGAMGTYLFAFNQTLNNHSIAAASAFITLYALQKIASGESRTAWTFATAGFFGAFTACNELPAALFGILLFLLLLVRRPSKTFTAFVPAAAIPCVAFLVTQFASFGQFKPVYEEFGTKTYNYEGSYWNTPLEMDWFNLHPEPTGVYLFHMTFGHHGVFSLTPIFLFSMLGALRLAFGRSRLTSTAWLTLLLTIGMTAFYAWNPKARNYGGSTQGLRWLFWLIPFWLVVLPAGLSGAGRNVWVRRLSLAALLVSAVSVGYAIRNPWSHPWLLDAMEHLNLYELKR